MTARQATHALGRQGVSWQSDDSYLENVTFEELKASGSEMNPLACLCLYLIDALVVIIIV